VKFLVFQHLDVEHPGLFRDYMREADISWSVIEWDQGGNIKTLADRMDDYAALLVMGGPMNVWEEDSLPWLVDEKAAIRHWVKDIRRPFLGICLGHQLLASALGGTVGCMNTAEVGVSTVSLLDECSSDPLFAGIATPLQCVQWHEAEVKTLPADTVILAASDACPVQAMRHRSNSYGIQFHIEVTDTTVQEWGDIPAYAAALEQAMGEGALEKFDRDVREARAALYGSAKRLFTNFHSIVQASCAHASSG
jgi:GMP synthase-like glutamine amidotransferase